VALLDGDVVVVVGVMMVGEVAQSQGDLGSGRLLVVEAETSLEVAMDADETGSEVDRSTVLVMVRGGSCCDAEVEARSHAHSDQGEERRVRLEGSAGTVSWEAPYHEVVRKNSVRMNAVVAAHPMVLVV
jgi:hypothetical protein